MRKTSHMAASCRKGERLSAAQLPLFDWAEAQTADAFPQYQSPTNKAEEPSVCKVELPSIKPSFLSQPQRAPVLHLVLPNNDARNALLAAGGTLNKYVKTVSNTEVCQSKPLDPRSLAETHGTIETVECCRRCGAIGRAHYAPDGWGFFPRTRCGDPLKCGDKPNNMSGSLPLIEGGKA